MNIEKVSTLIFAIAILHTFAAPFFNKLAHKYSEGSIRENLFHLLGEVEVVFGLWSGVFFILYSFLESVDSAIGFVETLNFTEPAFIFVVMAIAGTYPILKYAEMFILKLVTPLHDNFRAAGLYFLILTAGSILGSFITEPAAMTLCALLLRDFFFREGRSQKFLYLTLAALLVNISIGGTLTHFAAPPIVMVASPWGWDLDYVFQNFGVKYLEAILLNGAIATVACFSELKVLRLNGSEKKHNIPIWVFALNILFLTLVVKFAHHIPIFIALFLFFLGIVKVTHEYHQELPLRQSLLVGFFLAGLVVIGKLQAWWLQPLISTLSDGALFIGAAALTAITDNAALTYLGSQVPYLPVAAKHALVGGAVAGGGLTVIANAPNPIGFAFLGRYFEGGVSAWKLFIMAFPLTILSMLCFWFL